MLAVVSALVACLVLVPDGAGGHPEHQGDRVEDGGQDMEALTFALAK